MSEKRQRTIIVLLWLLVLGAMPLVARFDSPIAWDIDVYRHAMRSVRMGHDPYAEATAVQEAALRAQGTPSPTGPFNYDYSPITLSALKFFAWLPLIGAAVLYGLLYVGGIWAQNRFGLGLMTANERRILQYLAPVAIFFPGLLGSDNVMSGNVAYILYGGVLLTLGHALRKERWGWFYAAVLAASCFKPPMLCLLAIPVLCARRQWLPAFSAGTAGLGLFALQPLLFPHLFSTYLKAVRLIFSYNRDFGFSPAGLYSGRLFDRHLSYSPAGQVFYLAYAVPLFAGLIYLSHRYKRGDFTLQEWIPVALVGAVLLNPRLIEYDVAPLTLPLAIICWRALSIGNSTRKAVRWSIALFLPLNLVATHTWSLWKMTECPLLAACLLAGIASLLRSEQMEPVAVPAILAES